MGDIRTFDPERVHLPVGSWTDAHVGVPSWQFVAAPESFQIAQRIGQILPKFVEGSHFWARLICRSIWRPLGSRLVLSFFRCLQTELLEKQRFKALSLKVLAIVAMFQLGSWGMSTFISPSDLGAADATDTSSPVGMGRADAVPCGAKGTFEHVKPSHPAG